MATLSWPARAPKIIRQRSATCCGVPYEDSHFSSSARSAGSNLITRLVFGMSEIIATADKAVKLFKGHYTSMKKYNQFHTHLQSHSRGEITLEELQNEANKLFRSGK